MHAAASTGLRFHRMKGSSVEYRTPSAKLPASVSVNGSDPTAAPMASPTAPVHNPCTVRLGSSAG